MVGKSTITTKAWLVKISMSVAGVESHLFVEEPEQEGKRVGRGRKQREKSGGQGKGGKAREVPAEREGRKREGKIRDWKR